MIKQYIHFLFIILFVGLSISCSKTNEDDFYPDNESYKDKLFRIIYKENSDSMFIEFNYDKNGKISKVSYIHNDYYTEYRISLNSSNQVIDITGIENNTVFFKNNYKIDSKGKYISAHQEEIYGEETFISNFTFFYADNQISKIIINYDDDDYDYTEIFATYDNRGNVIKIEFNYDDYYEKYNFTYDDKKNPIELFGSFIIDIDPFLPVFSNNKNNIVSYNIVDSEDSNLFRSSFLYEYNQYDKPISASYFIKNFAENYSATASLKYLYN